MNNFRKKIDGLVFVRTEPTLRQNNAFLKLCIENKIAFSNIGSDFDFGTFLLKVAEEDLLSRLVQTMITQEHKIWSVDTVPLDAIEQLTESEVSIVFEIFFAKKRVDSILYNYSGKSNADNTDEITSETTEIDSINKAIIAIYGLENFNSILDVPARFFFEMLVKEKKDE